MNTSYNGIGVMNALQFGRGKQDDRYKDHSEKQHSQRQGMSLYADN